MAASKYWTREERARFKTALFDHHEVNMTLEEVRRAAATVEALENELGNEHHSAIHEPGGCSACALLAALEGE